MNPDTENERQLWLTLEFLPLAIAAFGQDGRTQYVNAKFVELFGYDKNQVPTLEAWWQRASPDRDSYLALREKWQALLSSAKRRQVEVEPISGMAVCKDDRLRFLEMRAVILGDRMVTTVIDLTERQEAVQAATAAADRAIRAKSEFLARISRELHGQLNVIMGHTQLLELDGDLSAAQRSQLHEINEAGGQMLEMIKEVISLPQAAPVEPAEPAPAMRCRILVAEDYEPNRILLERQMSRLGHEVDFARDGMEALRMWQAAPYDMILTDCNMPVMGGMALAERIREIERSRGGHVPIVAISANTIQQDIDQCLSVGIDAFLGKPVQLQDLKQLMVRFNLVPQERAGQITPDREASTALPVIGQSASPLQTLMAMLGVTEPRELLRLTDIFINSIQDLLSQADKGLQAVDVDQVGQAMHKLKSSLRTIGDEALAMQAVVLESAARAGDWSVIRPGLPVLSGAIAQSISAIRDELQQMSIDQMPAIGQAVPVTNDWAKLQVLVVDDDPFMRVQISSMLQRLGVGQIRQAGDGIEALADLDAHPTATDIILSDLNMPGMDGVEFIRHLVARQYLGGIAFVSGEDSRVLSSVQALAKAQNLQVLGTLVKPVYNAAVYDILMQYGRYEAAVSKAASGPAISVAELLEGLEQDQFVAYLQPKVSASTLEVIGVEALARWNHPRHGSVPPGQFIPLAENNGLIEILTMAIFRSAIEAGSQLHSLGHKLKVAINYSAQSFGSLELPEFIVTTSQAAGLDPHYLIIEVTESGLMHDLTVALDVLSRLRLKGVSLSIDDFGTGYSSIDQLRRIPFSELKIDQSFVRGANQDPMARSILESSIEMAKKLNLVTVAEGVETQEDLEIVRSLGCDLVQGYLIAKPMALPDLIAWLQRQH
ncbi:MAG: EAL domain-containing protein [Hydrogenophilaceae bacterium]|nr:EAL domain-containing protein [Hydrogenophilaceae bacterium]